MIAPGLAFATGVFVGIIGTEYADLALQGGIMTEVDAYFASGVSQSVAAGRLPEAEQNEIQLYGVVV